MIAQTIIKQIEKGTMMLDYNEFIKLPDWKKMKLRKFKKFANYPVMTDKQMVERESSIYAICAYFSQMDFEEIISVPSFFPQYWVPYLETILTPRLLDYIDFDMFERFGVCYCCTNYKGNYSRKVIDLLNPYNKVLPIYGYCSIIADAPEMDFHPHLKRTTPFSRCTLWNPLKLYNDVIRLRIAVTLKKNGYKYMDYYKDLKTVTLLNYFI